MNTFLHQITQTQLEEVKKQVIENHHDVFCQKIRKEYPLEDFMDAIRESLKDPVAGKVLLALWKWYMMFHNVFDWFYTV